MASEADVGLTIVPGGEGDAFPVMVSITPSVGSARTPSDICCVVDVSGSMGSEATVQAEGGTTTGHGLSVLDVVKHATKTIIRNLDEGDRLALVAYSNEATTVFGLTACNEAGRALTEEKLSQLQPSGMTNLWDGLKTGLELLKAGQQPGRLQHIMLFTDGLPNINPPRGILPMVKRLKDKEGGKLPCTVSTFGFGYELDSELLSNLAIEGCGTYAFIPDAGFVGTVFVNAMTNLLVTVAKDVTLTLKPANGASFLEDRVCGGHPVSKASDGSLMVDLGTLQFGQSKDVLVPMGVPAAAARGNYLEATLQFATRSGVATSVSAAGGGAGSPATVRAVEPHRCRLLFVDHVRAAMQKAKLSGAERAQGKAMPLDEVQGMLGSLRDQITVSPAAEVEDTKALLEDLQGQVAEAFSREDWYTKWGIHYLPSLACAHLAQQCNNFKDPGVQYYGGDLFADLRDKADDIFCSLPAPTPSARPAPPEPARPAQQLFGIGGGARAPVAATPVSMASYYDRYAGCIDGECRIRLADGSDRCAAELRKGDVVATPGGGVAEVTCAVRTPAPDGRFLLVSLPGASEGSAAVRLTPYHPVHAGGLWRFPAELGAAEEQPCDAVYTFVLEDGASAVLVSGVACVALGHGLEEGAARHPFFGSRRAVVEQLSKLPGYEAGHVDLHAGNILRDPETGLVCGFAAA